MSEIREENINNINNINNNKNETNQQNKTNFGSNSFRSKEIKFQNNSENNPNENLLIKLIKICKELDLIKFLGLCCKIIIIIIALALVAFTFKHAIGIICTF